MQLVASFYSTIQWWWKIPMCNSLWWKVQSLWLLLILHPPTDIHFIVWLWCSVNLAPNAARLWAKVWQPNSYFSPHREKFDYCTQELNLQMFMQNVWETPQHSNQWLLNAHYVTNDRALLWKTKIVWVLPVGDIQLSDRTHQRDYCDNLSWAGIKTERRAMILRSKLHDWMTWYG